jgi:hypothetical protein
MKNSIKMLVAGGVLLSLMFLNSCSKNMQDAAIPAQNDHASDASDNVLSVAIAYWTFDSTWTEQKEGLAGVAHNHLHYSGTAQAHNGIAAFKSNDSGYVSYDDAGTTLPNLTSEFTVDFWVYAYPKEGGAQCIWCLPQTGAFWPDMHVLLDGYNAAQGDTALIKVMFKANKAIDYNEQWTVVGGIPHFYHHWSHIRYSYRSSTSQFTLKVDTTTYVDHVTLYTDGTNTTPLGKLNPNPGTHGIVIGTFQNVWDPVLFGPREPWMLDFKGRIDQLRVYKNALF